MMSEGGDQKKEIACRKDQINKKEEIAYRKGWKKEFMEGKTERYGRVKQDGYRRIWYRKTRWL